MENSKRTKRLIFFKYISTIISWTIFVLLSIIGVLLIYYFAASRLYVTKGDKYEPIFSIYTIVSGSMEPTINVYDVIINLKVNNEDDIKVNDVITFISTSDISNGKTVTHRVIGIKEMDDGSKCFVTRGDNNTTEDPSCATYQNIIGRVSAVIPGLGRIQFFLGSKFGWLLIVVLPALYIIIKDLIKLFKMSRSKEDEDTTDNIDNTMVISNLIKKNELVAEEENKKNDFVTHEYIVDKEEDNDEEIENSEEESNEDEIEDTTTEEVDSEESNEEEDTVDNRDIYQDDDEDEDIELPSFKKEYVNNLEDKKEDYKKNNYNNKNNYNRNKNKKKHNNRNNQYNRNNNYKKYNGR